MEDKEKKAIIGLWGPGGKGKSTTLNLLIELLGGIKRKGDQRIRLTYREKKIAITTYGDDKWQLQGNVDFFKKESCDIYITATRTRGGSVVELEKFEKKIGAEIIWISKSYSTSYQELINERQAETIKDVLDSVIDEWE